MTPHGVTFRVAGHPVTQGSKVPLPRRGGGTVLVESGGARHKLWRHAVNDEARRAWNGTGPLTGPVALDLVFEIAPPKTLTRRRRADGPVGARSGDLDKLLRAVLDAITGVIVNDDSQVRVVTAAKDWAGPAGPGVTVAVRPITPTD